MTTDKRWWRAHLSCENSDDTAGAVMALGAGGVEIASATELYAFLHGTPEERDQFRDQLETLTLTCRSISEVPEQNWVQRCDELWDSVQIGKLTVTPILEESKAAPNTDMTELRLCPGTGFGTGHHATTTLALELLQHPSVTERSPKSALDVGTGSGILAIAYHLLYQTECDAIDTDADALVNATENLRLNGITDAVRLLEGQLSDHFETRHFNTYDLVLANIYAEVLCQLEPLFYDHLNPDGILILAGIMAEKTGLVQNAFASESRWTVLEQDERDQWVGMMLRKQQK